MQLRDFHPKPKLIAKSSYILEPRFPVIDAHNHLGEAFGGSWDQRPVSELLDILNNAHVRVYIDLDGGWGEDILLRHLDYFKAAAPERFLVFGGVDWRGFQQHGDQFGEYAASRLRVQVGYGADGLKIWKGFGLQVKDQHGEIVSVDDPRLDPLWKTAGELSFPVVIHVADPVAFFWLLDVYNERWEELQVNPDWQFPSPPFPSFDSILNALANLVSRHPETTFIGAHVGCYAENLAWVGMLLDRCPNFFIDMSARIGELGRQPYTARQFFLKYADRILFGTDAGPNLEMYRLHYRFLETDDEYFNYDLRDPPGQGRWRVYGLNLPEDVLEKVYYRNAERVLINHRIKNTG